MNSTELYSSSSSPATGLGVAGVGLDFGMASSSSSSSPSTSNTNNKTPRWSTIRQRFSSIQSRGSPSVPEDSVDDAMWDKNDTAFLEQVAHDSPLLIHSPDRFESSVPRSSMSSSRPSSFLRTNDSAAISLSLSPSPSAASALSTTVVSHDPLLASAASIASTSSRPWPRSMHKAPSTAMLPDLPEQKRADDPISSPSAVSMPPPLLPSVASSSSFMAAGYPNARVRQSTEGSNSTYSSVAASPVLTHSLHAPSDTASPTSMQDQYPRSPSLHSSSSFTASSYVFRSFDDRTTSPNARQRTYSSHSAAIVDRRSSRVQIGSPLAPAPSSFSSRTSIRQDAASPVFGHVAATNAIATSGERGQSIASVLDSPLVASSTRASMQGGDDACSQSVASTVPFATDSMRRRPGSPTKASNGFASPSTAMSSFPNDDSEAIATGSTSITRKHTRNKSSLVSGLRKLMGKRERESKAVLAADDASTHPSLPAASEPSAPITDMQTYGGLNLVGLAPDALASSATISASQSDGRIGSHAGLRYASPSIAHKSSSLDRLRTFATPSTHTVAPDPPRSGRKSLDAGKRPLRDVLTSRPRRDSRNKAASRNSVIEHISHEQARRLTGISGPVLLPTEQDVHHHRAHYANLASDSGLPLGSDATNGQADETEPESIEMLATGSNSSSNFDGTNPTGTARAPFGFQSQAYRPHSRDSYDSIPASSSTSFGRPRTSDTATSFAPSHRPTLSLGSRSTLGSFHDGQLSDASGGGVSGNMMAPPPVEAKHSKRGHKSRRSLNSLVASRTWSSFLGSPVLGSSSTSTSNSSSHSLHHAKRVSGAVISRPVSVTSSAFSIDGDQEDLGAADVTLRGSDLQRAAAAAGMTASSASSTRAGSRLGLDSTRCTHSNFSEPGISVENAGGATNFSQKASSHGHSSCHFGRPPSSPHLIALAPPSSAAAAASSTSSARLSHQSLHSHSQHSQHSHQSDHSVTNSSASTSAASASASSTCANHLASPITPSPTSHRFHTPTLSSTPSSNAAAAARHQAPRTPRRPATGDGSPSNSPRLASSSSSFQSIGLSTPSFSSPLFQSSSLEDLQAVQSSSALSSVACSRPSAIAAAHPRISPSGSPVLPRKRPSFGLAIEAAAHSAFDSIPSPLLRTRRNSPVLSEQVTFQRPFSTSSTSATRTTPPASLSGTSPEASNRGSADTLSSSHHFGAEDHLEIAEVPREGAPAKTRSRLDDPLSAAVPALESAMAAIAFEPSDADEVRPWVSVPMDEDDSPRQYMEENWSRPPAAAVAAATGGSVLTYGEADELCRQMPPPRQYMIHSPNEEQGAASLASASTSASSDGRLSQASKDIAFGSIAGMVSKVFEHPFDLVKVRLQTQSADRPARYAGALDCFRQTYLHEGIRGLYRGLSMPVLGATLENACLFFTYNQMQSAIRWMNGESTKASASKAEAESPLSIPQLAIAAAGAGSVTSVVLTPIELIKCKMQVQMITRQQLGGATSPIASASAAAAAAADAGAKAQMQQARSLYTSAVARATASTSSSSSSSSSQFKTLDGPLTLLRRTIATDGIRGLWLGQTGTLLRETGGGIAWFLAFESCSRHLIARRKRLSHRQDVTKKDLGTLELVSAGALAGISYNVVLFPADSVKSTMQTEHEMRTTTVASANGGEKWKPTGFYQTFKKIYATRGVRGLYAGCGVTCLRSAPSSAIIFWMYNKLERLSDEYGL